MQNNRVIIGSLIAALTVFIIIALTDVFPKTFGSETVKTETIGGNKSPKNVILMVGDGMGVGQMEIARLFEHGKEGKLFMESLPHVALKQTYSNNSFVTDSAAAGTALAIGEKTNNETIGMNANEEEIDSISDLFQKAGKKVGIVSTNTATDATPAAFSASVANRSGQEEVARQQFENKYDVILGGGSKYFGPEEQNGKDLVKEFESEGYEYVANRDELKNASGEKLLGLFHSSYMNYKADREEMKSMEPTLKEMTEKSLEVLSKGENGFFVMLEGARIDHASHAADMPGIWRETVEFDRAVEYTVEWAKKDGNTLVVVLADHETMGIAASDSMDIEGLKKIEVSPEFMADRLVLDVQKGEYTTESIIEVFKKYAYIDITEKKVAELNKRIKDSEGKVYPQHKVGWEIGSMIAEHYNAGVISSDVRNESETGGHTGNMVPVMAYGVGSEEFEGILDNTDIPKLIAEIAGVKK
jgi:alkaline phosphatase